MSSAPKDPGSEASDPLIGRLIDGRYQVRSRIARGGMATVYLATDLRLERRVAIKVMHAHIADDHDFAQRFIQEARSAARLAHPNVVNVFDQGEDGETAYLVMEYLPGITLRALLKDYKRLTAEQTLDIMDSVLAGLAAAHHAGIVHRDLKPENVMLADDGRIKLADFGLARAATANTATGQALLGTIAYLSPELVSRGTADARSDIYALGIMLYEMLTGEQPYTGDAPMQIAYQHANNTVPLPSEKTPGVPAGFDELVRWATARNPEDRPRDAKQMLERLRQIEADIRGGAGATVVLPQADVDPQATRVMVSETAPTALLGAGVASATNPLTSGLSPAAATLALTADRIKRRRRAMFALVLLLAGLAAATGWFFGSGPGSFVAVPNVAGAQPAAAEQTLQAAGFQTAQEQVYDYQVPVGAVIGSDPKAGTPAPPGSLVKVLVSLGPRSLEFPDVTGATESAARELLTEFTVEKSQTEFSASIPNGSVIRATDPAGNVISGTYPEKAPVVLVVSLGPVPDVTGKTLDEASQLLAAAGLAGNVTAEDFSDTVAAGTIISASPATDPIAPGGTVNLIVSKGPDLVAVPDVAGKPMEEAIQILKAAGFNVSYAINEQLVKIATAVGTTPAAGENIKRGSTVTIRAQVVV